MITWGLGPAMEEISDTSPSTILRDLRTGQVLTRRIAVDCSDFPDWGTERRTLQAMLYDQVCKAGVPVVFGAKVDVLDDGIRSASVRLGNNDIMKADLVIAADGIHSPTRTKILSDVTASTDPIISDTTAYITRLPLEEVRNDDVTKTLGDAINLNVWMGKKTYVVGRASEKMKVWGGSYALQEGAANREGVWNEARNVAWS